MSESTAKEVGLPSAVSFGLLEGLAFLCLFWTLVLTPENSRTVWLLLACLRVIVLGLELEARQSNLPNSTIRARWILSARFLGEASLYQVPFWVSALGFPFRPDQMGLAIHGLLFQTFGLIVVTLLISTTRFGAESLVYGVTWIWSGPGSSEPRFFALAAVGFLLAWILPRWRPRWARRFTDGQAFALGMAWLAVFGLQPLLTIGLEKTLKPLLPWLLLAWTSVGIWNLQDEACSNWEAECSSPGWVDGRFWSNCRQSALSSIGWLALVLLNLKEISQLGLLFCLILGWLRALELSARGWFTSERWVWWSAAEMTLLWAMVRSDREFLGGWILLSMLGWLWTRIRRRAGDSRVLQKTVDSRGDLEDQLRHGLRFMAPSDFAKRLAREFEPSLEFEHDLATSAPRGFRDRLLQRLRQQDEGDERQ